MKRFPFRWCSITQLPGRDAVISDFLSIWYLNEKWVTHFFLYFTFYFYLFFLSGMLSPRCCVCVCTPGSSIGLWSHSECDAFPSSRFAYAGVSPLNPALGLAEAGRPPSSWPVKLVCHAGQTQDWRLVFSQIPLARCICLRTNLFNDFERLLCLVCENLFNFFVPKVFVIPKCFIWLSGPVKNPVRQNAFHR